VGQFLLLFWAVFFAGFAGGAVFYKFFGGIGVIFSALLIYCRRAVFLALCATVFIIGEF